MRHQRYQRATTATIEQVLPLIKDELVKKTYVNGYFVNTKSLRLKNFARSIVCSCCCLKATHFAVDSNSGRVPSWHLNLWAESTSERAEMLFTHDHTLARALGGSDTMDNTTTMCAQCNSKKSVEETRLVNEIRKNKTSSNP